MKVYRTVMVGLVSAVICLGLLFLIYPWSTYYGNFRYGAVVTVTAYLLLALLVGIIGAIVVVGLSFTQLSTLAHCALIGVLSFTILCIGSLLLGPGGIELFNARMRGIFFSEWKFVTFIGTVALPISILNAFLVWWITRRKDGKYESASTQGSHL